jgi:plasmid stabilization system protein ParE
MSGPYTVEVSNAAKRDIVGVIRWSAVQFGQAQSARYHRYIRQCLIEMQSDPWNPKCRANALLPDGVFLYGLTSGRRRSSHFFVIRIEQHRVLVARLLHFAMNVPDHLPDDF